MLDRCTEPRTLANRETTSTPAQTSHERAQRYQAQDLDGSRPSSALTKPSYLGVACTRLEAHNTGRQNPTRMACRPNMRR